MTTRYAKDPMSIKLYENARVSANVCERMLVDHKWPPKASSQIGRTNRGGRDPERVQRNASREKKQFIVTDETNAPEKRSAFYGSGRIAKETGNSSNKWNENKNIMELRRRVRP